MVNHWTLNKYLMLLLHLLIYLIEEQAEQSPLIEDHHLHHHQPADMNFYQQQSMALADQQHSQQQVNGQVTPAPATPEPIPAAAAPLTNGHREEPVSQPSLQTPEPAVIRRTPTPDTVAPASIEVESVAPVVAEPEPAEGHQQQQTRGEFN